MRAKKETGKKNLYLNWASHFCLSFQNFIFPERKHENLHFFWFWVGGWFGLGGWVRQISPTSGYTRPRLAPGMHCRVQVQCVHLVCTVLCGAHDLEYCPSVAYLRSFGISSQPHFITPQPLKQPPARRHLASKTDLPARLLFRRDRVLVQMPSTQYRTAALVPGRQCNRV